MTDSVAARAPLRLLSFGPQWGCPSVDPSCTKAHAHLLFCGLKPGVDFAIEQTILTLDAMGELPVLQINSKAGGGSGSSSGSPAPPVLADPRTIYRELPKLGFDPDARLTPAQRAESLAFQALIEEQLGVALLYSWWLDKDNYDAVVKPAFYKVLSIPLCFYIPWSMRRQHARQLARRRCASDEAAYEIGEGALDALAARLGGGGDYFFGAEPSGVDACAFAYLNSVLRCPLPHDRLRVKLRSLPVLVSYCERISARFFGEDAPLLPPMAPPVRLADKDAPPKGSAAAVAAAAASSSSSSSSSSSGGQQQPQKDGAKPPRSAKQQAFRRRSRNAVLGALGAALVYGLATDVQNSGGGEEEEEGQGE